MWRRSLVTLMCIAAAYSIDSGTETPPKRCPLAETIHMDDAGLTQCELDKVADRTALHAISRAGSEQCRRRIEHFACEQRTGGYLPDEYKVRPVPADCPLLTTAIGEDEIRESYLGCYEMLRNPAQGSALHTNVTNIQECIYRCYFEGAMYAAMMARHCLCFATARQLEEVARPIRNHFRSAIECYDLCPVGYEDIGLWPCGLVDNRMARPAGRRTGAAKQNLAVFDTGIDDGALRKAVRFDHKEASAKMAAATETDIASVRVLYILLLNGRNFDQVRRLYAGVYAPRHFYYVHVDERAKYMWMRIMAGHLWGGGNETPRNVLVAPECHRLVWGGASLPFMLREIVNKTAHWPWNYAVRMTEKDLPVLPVRQFEKFLAVHLSGNWSFISLTKPGQFRDTVNRQGMERLYTQCDDHLWEVGARGATYLRNVVMHGSTDLFVAHRQFMRYASSSAEPLPRGLLQLAESSAHALEEQYATLAYNSRYCTRTKDHMVRVNNFRRPRSCNCNTRREPPTSDRCVCSPVRLRHTPQDLRTLDRNLLAQQHVYFARKFDALFELDLVNRMLAQSESGAPMALYAENTYHRTVDGPSRLYDAVAACAHYGRYDVAKAEQINAVRYAARANADRPTEFALRYADAHGDRFEVLVKPRLMVTKAGHSGIKQLRVGTRYDAKEFSLRDTTAVTLQAATQNIVTMVALWRHAKPVNVVLNRKAGLHVTATLVADDMISNTSTRVEWHQSSAVKQNHRPLFNVEIFDLQSVYPMRRFVDTDLPALNTTGNYRLTLNMTDGRTWATDLASVEFPVFPSESMLRRDGERAGRIACALFDRHFDVLDRCSDKGGGEGEVGRCEQKTWSALYER